MGWPKEEYPIKTSYALIELFRRSKLRYVAISLMIVYLLICFSFGILYFVLNSLKNVSSFLDYIYFSFITSLTIGYGDVLPANAASKMLTIMQGIVSTFYYSVIISLISVKILFPYHTIHFSEKVLFSQDIFIFRIINTHRALLVNPEIRISITEHVIGNVCAQTHTQSKTDKHAFLDNHDFILGFPDKIKNYSISADLQKAIDAEKNGNKTRFKISISVSGTYGMQQYCQVKNYNYNDIVNGNIFKAISYNDEDKKIIRNIDYRKFGDFWNDFNTIT